MFFSTISFRRSRGPDAVGAHRSGALAEGFSAGFRSADAQRGFPGSPEKLVTKPAPLPAGPCVRLGPRGPGSISLSHDVIGTANFSGPESLLLFVAVSQEIRPRFVNFGGLLKFFRGA